MDLDFFNSTPKQTPTIHCSAKNCTAPAAWVIIWNNPKIHTPEREKNWLACPEHRDSLSRFLDLRGFLKRIDPYVESAEPGQDQGA